MQGRLGRTPDGPSGGWWRQRNSLLNASAPEPAPSQPLPAA